MCGLNIVVHGDELDDLVQHYEVRGTKRDECTSINSDFRSVGRRKSSLRSLRVASG